MQKKKYNKPFASNRKLTEDDIIELKQKLWDGFLQKQVAELYDLSQPHVSRIVQGDQWPEVPWPDGTYGAINEEHYRNTKKINKERNKRIIRSSVAPISNIKPEDIPDLDPQTEEYADIMGLSPEAVRTLPEQVELSPDEIAEAAGKAMEQQFADDFLSVGDEQRENVEKPKEINISDLEALPWEEVALVDPFNPAIIYAENDIQFREVLCRAFKLIEPVKWDTKLAESLLHQIADGMGYDLTARFYLGEDRRRGHHPGGSAKYKRALEQGKLALERKDDNL